jgi:NodT family efflux transporter outer membrane factor (OMF) lipoprotein
MKKRIATAGLFLLLAACTAVGPDYARPEPDFAPGFHAADAAAQTAAVRADWWEAFDDPQLAGYVRDAVESNNDVAVGRARIREARALRRSASSRSLPRVAAGASYQSFETSENGVLGSRGLGRIDDDLYEGSFDAVWEVDVFGGARREAEAADARLGAAVEAHRAVLLSVVSEVARNYVELRGAQRRVELARRNVRIQSDTLELVENKAQAGLASELDVRRAGSQLRATRSRVPQLRAAVHAAALRIAVLTGRRPDELLDELSEPRPVPAPAELVPVGLPSELLLRRADVRGAELELRAATADIGIATSALYPRFFLTGAVAVQSVSFTDAFDAASRAWSLGSLIRWPVFQGGRLRADVSAAEARREVAYQRFQQAVLTAIEDVERSLVDYAEQQLARRELELAVEAGARAVDLASTLYDEGLTDFLTVIDAERTLRDVEDQLAASETAAILEVIRLYKALGGGWEVFEAGS